MKWITGGYYQNLFTISSQNLTYAVAGGFLIAVASSLYYLLFGNILGMSGMLGSLVKAPTQPPTRAKFLVLLGVLTSSLLASLLLDWGIVGKTPFDLTKDTANTNLIRLMLSGALVGLGTELGSGCTSGHGLCGLPRFSLRSFTAVIIFLVTAIFTSTSFLHKQIPRAPQSLLNLAVALPSSVNVTIVAGVCLSIFLFVILLDRSQRLAAKLCLFVIGLIFGSGLMISGMTRRAKIYGFLEFTKSWDPSLLIVLMTGVLFNIVTFSLIRLKLKTSMFGAKVDDPKGKITWQLIMGAVLFGFGWGLGGLCPGPYVLASVHSLRLAVFWGIPFLLFMKLSSVLFGPKAITETGPADKAE